MYDRHPIKLILKRHGRQIQKTGPTTRKRARQKLRDCMFRPLAPSKVKRRQPANQGKPKGANLHYLPHKEAFAQCLHLSCRPPPPQVLQQQPKCVQGTLGHKSGTQVRHCQQRWLRQLHN
eukprot:1142111-Pelagomonas_calceolata.AAC.4